MPGPDDTSPGSIGIIKAVTKAFDVRERQLLGLFSLFSKVLDVEIAVNMGVPLFVSQDSAGLHWALPELSGLFPQYWDELAERAAKLQIIAPLAPGVWQLDARVADALRTFLPPSGETTRMRAYVESTALSAHNQHGAHSKGEPNAARRMALNEANYISALTFATRSKWSHCTVSLLEALQHTHDEPARIAAWRSVLDSTDSIFYDGRLGSAPPETNPNWSVVSSFRVRLMIRERRLPQARELQLRVVAAIKEEARPWFVDDRRIDDEGLNAVERFTGEMTRLAAIYRELGEPQVSLNTLEEAFRCSNLVSPGARQFIAQQLASISRELGRNEEAERWAEQVEQINANPSRIALSRVEVLVKKADALAHLRDDPSRMKLLLDAALQAREALRSIGSEEHALRVHLHSMLGYIQAERNEFDDAIKGYQEALFFAKAIHDWLRAGRAEGNIAGILEANGHRRDALEALRRAEGWFQKAGEPGIQELEFTRRNITKVEADIRKTTGINLESEKKVEERNRVIQEMISAIRRGKDSEFAVGLVGYFIDGIPYSSSGLSIDRDATLDIHSTDEGFACTALFSPSMLQPSTVKKFGTVKGTGGDFVKVPLVVMADDIFSVTEFVGGKQVDLFLDAETMASRKTRFTAEMYRFFEKRTPVV